MQASRFVRRARVLALLAGIGVVAALAACSSDDDAPPFEGSALSPEDRLRAETGTSWIVDVDPATGAADLVVAVDPIPATGMSPVDAARAFLAKHKDLFRLTDPARQLVLEEVANAEDGSAHVRFGQREGGLRVDGAGLAVHFRPDGSLAMISAAIAPLAASAVGTPTIGQEQAIQIAEARARTADPGYQRDRAIVEAKLVLSPRGEGAVLAWAIAIDTDVFGERTSIDAKTGDLFAVEGAKHALEGSGLGALGTKRTFEIIQPNSSNPNFAMHRRGDGDKTRMGAWDKNKNGAAVMSEDPTVWDRVAVGAGAAVDGYFYVGETDKYFRSTFGWRGMDGKGGPINVYVHDNSMRNNAFQDSSGLHFSDGNGSTIPPLTTSPDVVAHEYMHGVIANTSGLTYANLSGALNESLADIFGSYAEADFEPSRPRFVFDDVAKSFTRDFVHPMKKNAAHVKEDQVDHLSLSFYKQDGSMKPTHGTSHDIFADHGGVHKFSGISNNAWYLMTVGGTNDTSGIAVGQAIGLVDSRKLWWHIARFDLKKSSGFSTASRDMIAYAKITGRSIDAVGCAWVAVGVIDAKYLLDKYKVTCGCPKPGFDDGSPKADAGTKADAGASSACRNDVVPPIDGGATPPASGNDLMPPAFDSCKGRANGVYCSELSDKSSIVCVDETIAAGQQCASGKCIGPNGAGTKVQCSNEAGSTDEGPADSCVGRPDGLYCSTLAPFSAIQCTGGSITGGQQCASGRSCAGPNGPGTTIVCK